MKVLKKAIYTILIIVLGFTVVGNVSGANDTVFSFLHFGNFVVLTGSMEPSISPGDYITVVKTDINKLEVGDVITYRYNGSTVTHKIVEIGDTTVTTQGTANNVADDPIDKSNIVGKYLFKIPKIGYIMSFLSSTAGLILIFGFVGIAIFWELTDPNRGKKKQNSQVINSVDTYIDDPEYLEYLEFKKRREQMKNEVQQPKAPEIKSEVPKKKIFEVKIIGKKVAEDNNLNNQENEMKEEKIDKIEKTSSEVEDAWNVSSTRVKRSAKNRKK